MELGKKIKAYNPIQKFEKDYGVRVLESHPSTKCLIIEKDGKKWKCITHEAELLAMNEILELQSPTGEILQFRDFQ